MERNLSVQFVDSWASMNAVIFILFMAQEPVFRHSLHIIEASRSHSETTHSVGLLWTSDQPVAETST